MDNNDISRWWRQYFSHAISGPNGFPCRCNLWVWVLLHEEIHVLFNNSVDVDGFPVLG
jgi:hypothetical protein